MAYVYVHVLCSGLQWVLGIVGFTWVIGSCPFMSYVFPWPRFCGLPYHPFDRSEVRKYVVTEDYTPPWEVRGRVTQLLCCVCAM